MEFSNNIGEYKESIIRPKALPREVEKVWKDIEYSNKLRKAHDIMKILDLPDSQDDMIRKELLKQDDKCLEDLANKSKKDIQNFLLSQKKNEIAKEKILTHKEENETTQIKIEQNQKIDLINETKNLKEQQTLKNEQDIQKIKSVFTPQILEQNPNLAKEFNNFDKEWSNKQEILNNILTLLKDDKILKSITEQLWWADKNNPKYQEFKTTLVWLDSWFDKYFQDLEKISSWRSLNADEVIRWIEKDSWWMIDIDLNSNIPTSKLSLIWSHYSFDEEIDKQVLEKITLENKDKLDELQSSFATLKGVYTPFDWLLKNIKANWWKENLKEKINESISNFSKNIFTELDEVYEKTGIKSDIQIKESDISSFADIKSENDLKQKIDNFKNKIEKIKAQLVETQNEITDKYQTQIKESLTLKSKEKEKQVKVLNFMRDSGFDLMPKEISDKFIQQLQSNTLNVPWLDLDTKNINLKNGNFWESVLYKDDGLNIHSKTNMLKFMNKMISWDINQPLNVEAIANGSETINPSSLQNKFLEAWIVDNLGWKEWKISENLSKWNNWWIENKA